MPLPSPFIDPWRSALCSAAALDQPLGAASSQPLSAQMHEVPVIAAQMRAAVNIEDLPGHGTGPRQIKHGFDDLLSLRPTRQRPPTSPPFPLAVALVRRRYGWAGRQRIH